MADWLRNVRYKDPYSDVVRYWLTGEIPEGNTRPPQNDRMPVEGDTIYSYGAHFPIARLDRLNDLCLFTTSMWTYTRRDRRTGGTMECPGPTTRGHMDVVRSHAAYAGFAIVYVDDPADVDERESIMLHLARANTTLAAGKRARKNIYKHHHAQAADTHIERALDVAHRLHVEIDDEIERAIKEARDGVYMLNLKALFTPGVLS